MTESKDLVVLESLKSKELFKENGLKRVLDEIAKKAKEHKPDVSTAKGRDEIASLAYKVSRSKTFIEKMAKDFVADLKAEIKPIDDARIAAVKTLDNLREEVRDPLTKWEIAEKTRADGIKKSLEVVRSYHLLPLTATSEDIKVKIAKLSSPTMVTWDEFLPDCTQAKKISLELLESQLTVKLQYEADQAELAKLREQQAEKSEPVELPESTLEVEKSAKVDEPLVMEKIRVSAVIASESDLVSQQLAAKLNRWLLDNGVTIIEIETTNI